MEDYYEYLDSNGVTTLYKLIKDDTVALIDSYSVTINGITTTLDSHVNNTDIHTTIATIEGMIDTAVGSLNYATPNYVDTKIAGLVNSAPETLDTLQELSDALGNDPNFATTVANQIGNKANKDSVYTKEEADTLLEGKANSVHNHVVKDITDFPNIPTKVSELSNDSNFVTSTELHDYATKNDLNSKQDALSEEQLSNIDSIPDKANKSDLSTVATSGSYKDLLDKPVIPEGADLSDYYNKGETDNLLNSKANTSDLAVVAKSGNYNDLNNTPTIPTKVSDLTNDSGYITNVTWEDVIDKPELSQVAISGSYSDLSGTPTIPTRTSQLINDSGFLTSSSGVITSVSWSDITDKPNFSTVATSGSYTDLSNTPTIPTKLSQLENDMGFGTGGDTSDCVHKTGDETIAGVKTFTASPFVSNYAVTNGFFTKLNTIARNEVPSQIYHSAFRVFDKNAKTLGEYCVEKSTSGSSLLHMDVHTEDSEGNDIMESIYLNLSNDGSTVSFHPAKNNRTDLGMEHYKWANAYINRVVCTRFTHSVNNGSVYITGGSEYDKGATLVLHGEESSDAGTFIINSRDKTRSLYLVGKPDGTLQWAGQNIALDGNVVHKTGNEAISGAKIFLNDIFRKNTSADLTVTPTGYTNTNIIFADKNDKTLAHIEYVQRPSGVNDVGIFARDKNGNAHGIHINTNNEVIPLMSSSESYSLGSATYKWKKIYSDDVVHTTGDEQIHGTKMFSNTIHRYADLTTSGGAQVYRFDDTNTNACGHIYNNVHWHNNAVYNRHGSYNAKSGKTLELDLITNNLGRGTAYISGNVTDLGNLTDATHRIDERALATMGWVNNPATSTNVVHRSGNETINGIKMFTDTIHKKNSAIDLQVNPSASQYNHILFTDKNNVVMCYLEHVQTTTGVNALGLIARDKNNGSHGIQVTSEDNVIPLGNGVVNLGLSGSKWKNVYATTFNGNSIKFPSDYYITTDANDNSLRIIRHGTNHGNNYKIIIQGDTGKIFAPNGFIGNLQGNADTATYSTPPATSDNSTRIATTAWVRNYVNSVVGSGSVGASISAYYSNATTLTAKGNSSTASGYYPSDYSDYINIAPTVGTIYTGSQLFSSFTPTASGNISINSTGPSTSLYHTTAKATATFSGALVSTGKYLCTTANAVKFRAYVSQGTSGSMGSPSVVDNSSAKSIFIRVQ